MKKIKSMSQPYVKEDPKTGLLIEWIPAKVRCRPSSKPRCRVRKKAFMEIIELEDMTLNGKRAIEGHRQLNERVLLASKVLSDFGVTGEEFARSFNNKQIHQNRPSHA